MEARVSIATVRLERCCRREGGSQGPPRKPAQEATPVEAWLDPVPGQVRGSIVGP